MNKEEKREYDKQYRALNKEKLKEKSHQKYLRRKEVIAEQGKQYREDHQPEIKARRTKYYKSNRDELIKKSKEFYQDNKTSIKEKMTQYYINNRPKMNEMSRQGHLKRKYGISIETYNKMLLDQCGVCAICGNPPSEGKILHVDHNHTTKKVRELLCSKCNAGLGYAKEDTTILQKMITYLEKHN